MSTKRPKQNQQYDEYWKLTVEYTDIFGRQFNGTLRLILDFIDNNKEKIHSVDIQKYKNNDAREKRKLASIYKQLQLNIASVYHKEDMGSVRKSINQFVKLGFVEPYLWGYHKLARKFLKVSSSDKELKKSIFSEIFYNNASFNSSVTVDNTEIKQINFLLKTLMYHPRKKLSRNDLIGIMVTDLTQFRGGFLPADKLEQQYNYSKAIHFEKNKYNQIAYMFTFLNLMPDLVANKDEGVAYTNDDLILPRISAERDPYYYSLYRHNLEIESQRLFNDIVDYVNLVNRRGLVASHLKPSATCLRENKPEEAYDYNNGILLDANLDAYFDKFEISFDNDGSILIGPNVRPSVAKEYESSKLDPSVLNEERLKYLSYHRNEFYKRNNLG